MGENRRGVRSSEWLQNHGGDGTFQGPSGCASPLRTAASCRPRRPSRLARALLGLAFESSRLGSTGSRGKEGRAALTLQTRAVTLEHVSPCQATHLGGPRGRSSGPGPHRGQPAPGLGPNAEDPKGLARHMSRGGDRPVRDGGGQRLSQ